MQRFTEFEKKTPHTLKKCEHRCVLSGLSLKCLLTSNKIYLIFSERVILAEAHLDALVSLIRGPSRRVGEDVGLRVLRGPELLLACLQHHGGLHHVLLIFVLVEASPHHAGIEPVFVSVTGAKPQNKVWTTKDQ